MNPPETSRPEPKLVAPSLADIEPGHASPAPKKRKWGTGLAMLVLLGAAGGVYYAQHRHTPHAAAGGHAEQAVPPVVVTAESVRPRVVARHIPATGSLFGYEEIVVQTKVDGRVVQVPFDVGDRVKPGELLLEIEDRDYRLALAEVERGLELELARLGLTELPAGELVLDRLPAIVRAEAERVNAQARWNRAEELDKRGILTREERDTAQLGLKVAQAAYQQSVLEAQSTLASARQRAAMLATAEQRLSETKVLVPADVQVPDEQGQLVPVAEFVVAERNVTPGEMVHGGPVSNKSLFRLVVADPLELKLTLPERDRGPLAVGQPVSIEVEYFPGETFPGTIHQISPAVDRVSRTFTVEVRVPNADRRLSPGSFAKARIEVAAGEESLTVPEEAVVTFAGVTKLYVLGENDTVREVPVAVAGLWNEGGESTKSVWREVKGDLKPTDRVVTSGQTRLADGTAVKIREVEKK